MHLLRARRAGLDRVAGQLLEQEEISGKEVYALLGQDGPGNGDRRGRAAQGVGAEQRSADLAQLPSR